MTEETIAVVTNAVATKEYTGSCYIGVVGSENEIGECRDSIDAIQRRQGDSRPVHNYATKGYEAREIHLERWYTQTDYPFCLLLDHDQVFPPDTLERLRSHKLPYVSGYYLRRRYQPIAPVWFEPFDGQWPYKPFMRDPERGRLHPIGASGWGCMLIHRDVVTAVKPLLKGERLVLEDDMDVWPYDTLTVTEAIRSLRDITKAPTKGSSAKKVITSIDSHLAILEKEFRLLRGDNKTPIGSDIRFPFFALQAGFQLFGDPDCRVGHMLNYPLHPDDYSGQADDVRVSEADKGLSGYYLERRRMRELGRIAKGEAWQCQKCGLVNPTTLKSCDGCGEVAQ